MSDWCNSTWKRVCDVMLAIMLLVPALPLMGIIALIVRVTSEGPILFRQQRPGRNRVSFQILKFRSMQYGRTEPGPVLTRSGDPRLTWIGRLLRRYKLDELPQLFNVLAGHMSFVGPRPQPAKLWEDFVGVPKVLMVRPGITGAATLAFRNEEEILSPLAPHEVETVYLRYLMPVKMRIDLDYLRTASWTSDLRLMLDTFVGVVRNKAAFPEELAARLPDFAASPSGREPVRSDVPAHSVQKETKLPANLVPVTRAPAATIPDSGD